VNLLRRRRSDRTARRLWLVLWASLALLWQGFVMPGHAVAMATGIEVCGAAGPARVDADGHRLDGHAQHKHDDCCWCCIAHLAAPPPVPSSLPELASQQVPEVAVLQLGRTATCLAPLSRGPPTRG
jgi:hypothetical protein